jgi:hypothetical protein
MVQHSPTLFSLLHVDARTCTPTITYGAHTYFRARSTPRWVLYKRATTSSGLFNAEPM